MYRVIHSKDFKLYNVRHVPVKAVLIIGYCLKSGDDWYCANVISISMTAKNLIPYIRKAAELNKKLEQED
jgi:hypothetical protein